MDVLILIFAVFIGTLLLAWLLLFPSGRDAVFGAAGRGGNRAAARMQRVARASARRAGKGSGWIRRCLGRFQRFLRHNRYYLIAALLLACVPALVVMRMHRHVILDGFGSSQTYDDSDLIVGLLRGERLAPPTPLPPAMFTTREVELLRPNLVHASRNWQLLKPDFRQRLLVVYKLMREKYGYQMHMLEGYRSPHRQAKLLASAKGVTHAGAYQSYHQYGLAADSAFVRNGKLVISARDPWAMRGYRLYGKLAAAAGLTWGGKWTMRDYGHVELRQPGLLGSTPHWPPKRLRNKHG